MRITYRERTILFIVTLVRSDHPTWAPLPKSLANAGGIPISGLPPVSVPSLLLAQLVIETISHGSRRIHLILSGLFGLAECIGFLHQQWCWRNLPRQCVHCLLIGQQGREDRMSGPRSIELNAESFDIRNAVS